VENERTQSAGEKTVPLVVAGRGGEPRRAYLTHAWGIFKSAVFSASRFVAPLFFFLLVRGEKVVFLSFGEGRKISKKSKMQK
jgi:hypothetical protein